MILSEKDRGKLLYVAIFLFAYINIQPFLGFFNIYPIGVGYAFYLGTFILGIVVFTRGESLRIIKSFPVYAFLFLIIYMVLTGVLQRVRLMNYFYADLATYIRFFLMMLLGFQWSFFFKIKKTMIFFLLIGIILNMISLFVTTSFYRDQWGDQAPLAYSMQTMLAPAIFYLFLFESLSKKERIIVVTAFILYTIEQILFQKRLPVVRIALVVIIFFYYSRYYGRTISNFLSAFRKRIALIIIALFLGILFVNAIGLNMTSYFRALSARFYAAGSISETIKNDPRWEIGHIFYEDLKHTGEFVSGRGLGGIVINDSFMGESDIVGRHRSAAEMGVATMILKGGVFLVVYFALLFWLIIRRYKLCRKNIYSFAFWAVVFIWFIFIYSEGFLSYSSSINEIIIGYALGATLAGPNIIQNKVMVFEANNY